VTLTSNEPATVYYTVDGREPTASDYDGTGASPLSGIVISSDTTLKFFAIDTAGNEEIVREEDYVISAPDTTPPTTVATPPGGTYDSEQSVTLTSNEAATVYYTKDGREPTALDYDGTGASPLSGIAISTDTTLKFFAIDTAGNEESVKTQVYVINNTGIDPSNGSGGTIAAGTQGTWDAGGGMDPFYVRIPTSYSPETFASPVVWLCKEAMWRWEGIANDNKIILVDLNEDTNGNNMEDKILYAYQKLESEYNVDKARYYMAGWSAGGNFAVMFTDYYQDFIAASMVFPGCSQEQPPDPPPGRAAKYYFAVGDKDIGYYNAILFEVAWREDRGYTVRLDVVPNGGHGLPDSKRLDGWNWVKDFNLKN
jgi:dienelactone hydrolase